MKPLKRNRRAFDRSKEKLDRMRHLYAVIIRKAVEGDDTGRLLVVCAKRAIDRKLYSSFCEKSARFSVLRKFWRLNPAHYGRTSWHQYCAQNRWYFGTFLKAPKKVEAV